MISARQKELLRDYGPGLGAVLIGAALYVATLLPGIHEWGDVTKAQFLGKFLGMTHPTGYPLYILLTAPIAHLPLGELAYRINAFSAVCGVVGIWFAFLLQRELRVRPFFAAIGALTFGVSRIAWSQFVIAEVYALNAALVGCTLYLLARWLARGRVVDFVVACGVYALSFGNHLTMITLLPTFVAALAWGNFRAALRPWVIGTVAALIALGASQYLYLFWASNSDSLYLEYRVTTFDELVEFVTGERYRRLMFAFDWEQVQNTRLPQFASQFIRDLGPLIVLAPFGAAAVSRRKGNDQGRRILWMLAVAALGQFIWLVEYDIPDIEVYSIPLAWILSVFLGLGLDRLAGEKRWRSIVVFATALVFLGSMAKLNEPNHEKSKRFSQRIEKELQAVGRDGVLIGSIHYSSRMAYVYRIYADGLYRTHNLHLASSVSPSKVARYLEGRGSLTDSHTKQKLGAGLRLYVDSRGAKTEWGKELRLRKVKGDLREVVLRGE